MTINYQIWLTWNAEKEKMRLPVLPEKFDVKNGSNNRSVDLTGLGEVTIMQSRPALQFSFSRDARRYSMVWGSCLSSSGIRCRARRSSINCIEIASGVNFPSLYVLSRAVSISPCAFSEKVVG